MLNLTTIKSAIPLVFAFLIIGFIAKLGYDNIQLESDNNSLRDDVRQLNKKNDGLAESVKTLADQADSQNEIVKAESKRRAAAEMKQQRLQGEIAEMLRGEKCAIVAIPDGVVDRLRGQTYSIRGNKGKASANPERSAK